MLRRVCITVLFPSVPASVFDDIRLGRVSGRGAGRGSSGRFGSVSRCGRASSRWRAPSARRPAEEAGRRLTEQLHPHWARARAECTYRTGLLRTLTGRRARDCRPCTRRAERPGSRGGAARGTAVRARGARRGREVGGRHARDCRPCTQVRVDWPRLEMQAGVRKAVLAARGAASPALEGRAGGRRADARRGQRPARSGRGVPPEGPAGLRRGRRPAQRRGRTSGRFSLHFL